MTAVRDKVSKFSKERLEKMFKEIFRISNIVLFLSIILAAGVVGCQPLLDYITPTYIPDRVAEYAEEPNAAGINVLANAKELRRDVLITYRDNQTELKRMLEDDNNKYKDTIETIDYYITESQNMQDIVLNGDGEIMPVGIVSLLTGIGGLLAGRNFLKRPGDLAPSEVEVVETV